jgi:hypothetical protein
MDIELFRKQYDFELEQRNTIAASTNLPILGLTVIGSGLSSVIIGYQYSSSVPSIIFTSLVSICALLMLWTVYYIVSSLIGYTYEKIPSSKLMLEHFNELKSWYSNNHGSDADASNDFNDYIQMRLSEAADNNSSNNIKRGSYIHGATIAVAYSFIFLVLSSPFYIYQKTIENNPIYQVKIIQTNSNILKENTMTTSNDNSNTTTDTPAAAPDTPAAAPDTPAAAPATPVTKPTGPRNEQFKGNADLGKIQTKDNGSSEKGS